MKFIKSTIARYASALLLVFSSQAFGTSVEEIPGIPGIFPPGNPAFVNGVTIGMADWRDGFKLSVSEDADDPFLFQIGSAEYEVIGGSYSLTAYFDGEGYLDAVRSNVQIRGSFSDEALEALGDTERQHELWGGYLFSARLDDVGFSTQDGDLALGFSTTDFGGWAAQFGEVESVWLYNFDPAPAKLMPFLNALAAGTLEATAVTTVPVPAGIWLIGSVLLGYTLVGRRRESPAGRSRLDGVAT